MTSIDFRKLMREEARKLALSNTTSNNATTSTTATNTNTSYSSNNNKSLDVIAESTLRDLIERKAVEESIYPHQQQEEQLPSIPRFIEQHRCTNSKINSLYYLPDFVSLDEELSLLSELSKVEQWQKVKGRHVAMFGGCPTKLGLLCEPLPSFLSPLLARLNDVWGVGSKANHILVNRYDRVDGGIMPHTDGPLYVSRVCIVSFGASCRMDFSKLEEIDVREDNVVRQKLVQLRHESLVLRPRSLLVFDGDAYTKYLHAIPNTADFAIDEKVVNSASADLASNIAVLEREGDERVSLTIRIVRNAFRLKEI